MENSMASSRRPGPAGVLSFFESGLSERLVKLLRVFQDAEGDDAVCLGALDASTLRRYGYSERQITSMKEGSFR
jgi:hypothetical protein